MMGMAAAVLSGFVVAPAAPWIARAFRGAAAWILALVPLSLAVYFAGLIGSVARGQAVTEIHSWVPALGVDLSFRADGLSLLFALLISGVGVPVVIYAGGYLAGHPQRGRFLAYLLMFMASMLGVVLADNLVLVYVFWELTSISSYFLIGFHASEANSRAAAWQALLVTGAGGLCLLAGFLLLGIAGGSMDVSTLLGRGDMARAHPLYLPVLVLIGLGAATKSAQFPFHFWLPAAMAAPTPASAYLHSATMVKAGVYLLARLHPVLGGTDEWRYGLSALGAATAVAGAYLAWIQTDLKRILAYSTVGALGTLVMLVGWGSEAALVAAMVYLVAHAGYKGGLFLVTGSIDHATGTRDVTRLGGLRRAMPLSAVAAVLAGLSMAGAPPWLGFTAKELVYQATLGVPALLAVGIAANVVNVMVVGLAAVGPFFGPARAPGEPHEAPAGMWLGALVLGASGLFFGLASRAAGDTLFAPAAAAAGGPSRVDLSPLHGLSLRHGGAPNVVLIASVVTVLAGVAGYVSIRWLRRAARPLDVLLRWGPARWYEEGLRGMLFVAGIQTRVLQDGHLRHYLLVTIASTIAVVGAALAQVTGLLAWSSRPEIRLHEAVLAAVVLAAALVVAIARSRFAAVTATGVVGYGVALFFALFGAPDLAMTQFATETLTVILLVLVLHRMPGFVPLSSRPARGRDALVALAGGALMTALVLMAGAEPGGSRLTPYFAENSLSRAHGRNVVNVILVDFRALDTLGEITVLAVAALGAHALLVLRPEGPR